MRSLLILAAIALVAGCGSAKPEATPAATGSHDTSGPISEAKLGVKLYPGATIVTSGETDEIVSANLRTTDPAEKVIAFYETELGTKGSGNAASYKITEMKGGKKFFIVINNDGRTNVSIMGRK